MSSFPDVYGMQDPYMRPGSVFVGRKDVFAAIGRVLRDASENAILLYGQRGIGKTSVLRELAAWLPKTGRYRPIYFNLDGKAALPLDRVVEELAGAIATVLGLPAPELGVNPEVAFRHTWLPEALENLPQGTTSLVILFDEFEALDDPKVGQAVVGFYPYLRGLLSDALPRLKFVFALGRYENDLRDVSHLMFKTMPTQRLPLLGWDETVDLVLKTAGSSLQWSQDALGRVWELTYGQPNLVRLLCSGVWQRAYTQWLNSIQYPGLGIPEITMLDVDAAVSEFLETNQKAMEWLWDGLPQHGQAVIMALARLGSLGVISGKDVSCPVSLPELAGFLSESGINTSIDENQETLQRLLDWDLIETNDGNSYSFRIELYRRWLLAYKSQPANPKTVGERANAAVMNSLQSATALHSSGKSAQAVRLLYQTIQTQQDHAAARELLDGILMSLDAGEAVDILEGLFGETPAQATTMSVVVEQGKNTVVPNPPEHSWESLEINPKDRPADRVEDKPQAGPKVIPENHSQDFALDDMWPEQITSLQTQLEVERKAHLETRFNAEREIRRLWEQLDTEVSSLKVQLEAERQAHAQTKVRTAEEIKQFRASMAFELAVLQGQLEVTRRANEETRSLAEQTAKEIQRQVQLETTPVQRGQLQAERWMPLFLNRPRKNPAGVHKKKTRVLPPARLLSWLVLSLVGIISLGMLTGLIATQGFIPSGSMANIMAGLGLAPSGLGDDLAFPVPATQPSDTQLPANQFKLDGDVTDIAFSFARSNTVQGNILAVVKTGRIYVYSQDKMQGLWVSPEGERFTCVGFSPSGKFLAAGSQGHQVVLWDAANGKQLHRFSGHLAAVNSVAFSADGRLLASGSIDTTVIVWDMTAVSGDSQLGSGRLYTLQGHTKPVKSVAFSPTGYMLASASDDNTAVLWDITSALASENKLSVSQRVLQGHTRMVNQVAFSPDGKVLATCSNDRTVVLWGVASGKRLNTLAGYTTPVLSVAFSPDGKLLATGLDDNIVTLWDMAAALNPGTASASGLGVFTMLDSANLATRGQTPENGEQPHPAKGWANPVWSVVFSPDGRTLASASQDGTLLFWSIKP